jgi:hypothetical protein
MYEKLTKKEKVQEAKRRIEETITLNLNSIDLSGLGLDENDDIFIPEAKENPENMDYFKESFEGKKFWFIIDLSNNNFKSISNIPSVFTLKLDNNKNLKSIYLSNPLYILTFDNTNIETPDDIKNINNVKYYMNFSDTPLEKKYVPLRKLNKSQTKTHINEDNIKYSTYIIPKGTVLFRNFMEMKDLSSIYIGYIPKEYDENYYLHPDQYTFFLTSPHISSRFSIFGNIRSIFVLQNDIEVLLGFRPSIRDKSNISTFLEKYKSIFVEDCKSHKVKDNERYKYKCFRKEYKDLNIAGWFANIDYKDSHYVDINKLDKLKDAVYNPIYQVFNGDFYTPELAIYPRVKREYEDIITKVEDFNETWLKSHLSEFNYKPLAIFENSMNSEEYKKVFLEFMSPEGHTDESGTYHITINKKDGTYVLAELASEDTLKNCVPIKKDKTEYLKDFLEAQMNK